MIQQKEGQEDLVLLVLNEVLTMISKPIYRNDDCDDDETIYDDDCIGE